MYPEHYIQHQASAATGELPKQWAEVLTTVQCIEIL
jgi:hypothetical protein